MTAALLREIRETEAAAREHKRLAQQHRRAAATLMEKVARLRADLAANGINGFEVIGIVTKEETEPHGHPAPHPPL